MDPNQSFLPTFPASETPQDSQTEPSMEKLSETPSPVSLKEALSGFSRQQKRSLLRKAYQRQLRDMGAPLNRLETRLIAAETAKELLFMLRESEA